MAEELSIDEITKKMYESDVGIQAKKQAYPGEYLIAVGSALEQIGFKTTRELQQAAMSMKRLVNAAIDPIPFASDKVPRELTIVDLYAVEGPDGTEWKVGVHPLTNGRVESYLINPRTNDSQRVYS